MGTFTFSNNRFWIRGKRTLTQSVWRAGSAVQGINKDLESFCQPKILPVIVFDKIIIITVMADACYWKPVISNSCGMIMTATSTCKIKFMFPWTEIAHICKYPTYCTCFWKLTCLRYCWDFYIFRSFVLWALKKFWSQWILLNKLIDLVIIQLIRWNWLCHGSNYTDTANLILTKQLFNRQEFALFPSISTIKGLW